MGLFKRKKEEETDVQESKKHSMLESFVNEFETGFGEKFYRSDLFGNTPFFDSESKKVGVLPANIYQIIEQFKLNRVVTPSNLKRKNIGNTEAIGIEGGSWFDSNIYEKSVKALEKMGISDYRILMSAEPNNPVVLSALKFNVIVSPLV